MTRAHHILWFPNHTLIMTPRLQPLLLLWLSLLTPWLVWTPILLWNCMLVLLYLHLLLLAPSCALHLPSLFWTPPALWQWQKPWNLVKVLPCLLLHHQCLIRQPLTPPCPPPLVPTLHPNTHFAVRVVLTCGASIFLKPPWPFARPLVTSLGSTTARTRALPSLCPAHLRGYFSARWLPYWVTPSQLTCILPASTLREWSLVPFFITWLLRTSWKACPYNVFARCLVSPHHQTRTSCLLMSLLLLHL